MHLSKVLRDHRKRIHTSCHVDTILCEAAGMLTGAIGILMFGMVVVIGEKQMCWKYGVDSMSSRLTGWVDMITVRARMP